MSSPEDCKCNHSDSAKTILSNETHPFNWLYNESFVKPPMDVVLFKWIFLEHLMRSPHKNKEITGSFVKLCKNIQKMQQDILEDDKFSCWPDCIMDCSAALVFAIVTTWSVVWVNSVPISGAVTWSWNLSVAGLKKRDSPYLTQSGLCTTHIKLSLVCQYPALYSVIIKVSCHIAYSLQLLSLVQGARKYHRLKSK